MPDPPMEDGGFFGYQDILPCIPPDQIFWLVVLNTKSCVYCSQEFSYFSRSHVCVLCNAVCCSTCGGFSASAEQDGGDIGFYQQQHQHNNDDNSKKDSFCKSCLVWMRE